MLIKVLTNFLFFIAKKNEIYNKMNKCLNYANMCILKYFN